MFVKNTHPTGAQHLGKYKLLRPGAVVEVAEADLPKVCGPFVRLCDADGTVIEMVKTVKVRGYTRAAEDTDGDGEPGPVKRPAATAEPKPAAAKKPAGK